MTMQPKTDQLLQQISNSKVLLHPIQEVHLNDLREACAKDQEIWNIYPVSMLNEHFDQAIARFHETDLFQTFAVICQETQRLVGMTNFIGADAHGGVEIGGTYIAPEVRGTGFNRSMKELMIKHAFDCGFHRIQFCVDTRNERSIAAVLKLGATKEGVLRRNKRTWTGYVRDTAIFSILKEDGLFIS